MFHSLHNGQPMHPADVWPLGPNMVVSVTDIALLLNSGVCVPLLHLTKITKDHGIFVGDKCNRNKVLGMLMGHTCASFCPSLLIIFRPLKHPCRVPCAKSQRIGMTDIQNRNKDGVHISEKAKGKHRAVDGENMILNFSSMEDEDDTGV